VRAALCKPPRSCPQVRRLPSPPFFFFFLLFSSFLSHLTSTGARRGSEQPEGGWFDQLWSWRSAIIGIIVVVVGGVGVCSRAWHWVGIATTPEPVRGNPDG
jgi:hypothetical protein